jgi:NAD(P)-dependent dehydrogenase (short-subunit alcohol dehydrogenase family)
MDEPYRKFDLTNKIAIVTGASEGIGRDIALGLAKAGSDVVLCSRRADKLREVKTLVESMGRRAEIFELDVQSVAQIAQLKTFCAETFGSVDILVNNAGYAVTKLATEITEEDWDAIVGTGLKGVFFCCQAIGSLMRDQGYGKIINLSSTFSKSIVPGRSVYAATKAGVDHLTRALATEWAAQGIRVNGLAPTAVNSPSRQQTLEGATLESVLGRIHSVGSPRPKI